MSSGGAFDPAAEFGSRGVRLWVALGREVGSPAGELAVEACRLADRLDRFERLLSGGEWFELVERPEGSGRLLVVVDSVVSEARQSSIALKAILERLGIDEKAKAPAEEGNPLAAVLRLVAGDAAGDVSPGADAAGPG